MLSCLAIMICNLFIFEVKMEGVDLGREEEVGLCEMERGETDWNVIYERRIYLKYPFYLKNLFFNSWILFSYLNVPYFHCLIIILWMAMLLLVYGHYELNINEHRWAHVSCSLHKSIIGSSPKDPNTEKWKWT